MRLGIVVGGEVLTYDAALYEFRIGSAVTTYEEVRELDDHAHVQWCALEQRDWFRKINPADLAACNRREMARRGRSYYDGMTAEQRVQADAKRDDSVLAGKIVEADPATVQAVVEALQSQGLVGQGVPVEVNPLAVAQLPLGMEALSQMQRQPEHERRKMTHSEERLMRKILRNDDRDKIRREKLEAKIEGDAVRDQKAESKRRQDASTDFGTARFASDGSLITAERDAVRPSDEQYADIAYQDEQARAAESLAAMRKRNYDASANLDYTDVPGMERKGPKAKGQQDARINGRKVNPDGTPKKETFKKFTTGLSTVADIMFPAGGQGGPGGGGGGHGGSGGGGGMGGLGGGMGMGGGMGRM